MRCPERRPTELPGSAVFSQDPPALLESWAVSIPFVFANNRAWEHGRPDSAVSFVSSELAGKPGLPLAEGKVGAGAWTAQSL